MKHKNKKRLWLLPVLILLYLSSNFSAFRCAITSKVMMGVSLGVFSFIISCHLKASWQGNLP